MSTRGYSVSGITYDGQNKIVSALRDYANKVKNKSWGMSALASETVRGEQSHNAMSNFFDQCYEGYKNEALQVINEIISKVESLNSTYQSVDTGSASFLNPYKGDNKS